MAAAQSLAARDPTSLLFVEAAEDQIEVPMIILLMTRGSTNPVTSLRWLARPQLPIVQVIAVLQQLGKFGTVGHDHQHRLFLTLQVHQ